MKIINKVKMAFLLPCVGALFILSLKNRIIDNSIVNEIWWIIPIECELVSTYGNIKTGLLL